MSFHNRVRCETSDEMRREEEEVHLDNRVRYGTSEGMRREEQRILQKSQQFLAHSVAENSRDT